MKKAIVWILLLIMLPTASSCIICRRCFRPSGFSYKYDGKYTGLDTLMAIDGYYKSVERQTEPVPNPYSKVIRWHSAIMFYRDGLVCYRSSNNPQEVFRDRLRPVHTWGIYRVYGDTVKCQFITDRGMMGDIGVDFDVYRIVSKHEIVQINTGVNRDEVIPHAFYPLESRIDSTEWNWLLNKKWFWDKEAYEQWKKADK